MTFVTCAIWCRSGTAQHRIDANQRRDFGDKSERLVGFGARDGNPTKRQIALKNVQFECDAQWPFKGTYVRQDILHKTNKMEEQNPQSASALYVPLPRFT